MSFRSRFGPAGWERSTRRRVASGRTAELIADEVMGVFHLEKRAKLHYPLGPPGEPQPSGDT